MRRPNDIDKVIARNIRARRNALGLSLQYVSGQLGIAYQQLQKYENATNRISAGRLWELSQIYGVPIQELFEA